MLAKVNLAGSTSERPSTTIMEDKLGCYRLWARPKTPRKPVRSRPSHMVLGPYPLGTRK
ncbi:MAG: hypothetical protein JW955_02085 [Sedimentisphaerales bacterium]|nr:hypothetical protein [Sedimentisphaerales bacterium]